MRDALLETNLNLPNKRSGKVRDLYDVTLGDGGEALLIVATDRISAFDVVMANGLPGKGVVLTQISKFWFDLFAEDTPHHLISTDPADVPGLSAAEREALAGAHHALPQDRSGAHRVHRPRLHHRQRLEGLPSQRLGVRHRPAGGPKEQRPLGGAPVHPVHQGGHRP